MITRTPIEPENHPSNKEHGGGNEAKNGVKHTTKQLLFAHARFTQATLLHLGISFLLVIALVGFLSSCGSTENDEPYRTIDGSGNNLKNPQMNQAGVQLIRIPSANPDFANPDYGDGISSFAGQTRPNPREISNRVNAHPLPGSNLVNEQGLIPNLDSATNFVWLWGQFMDHDITFSEDIAEPANIQIPRGDDIFDPQRTGMAEMFFKRAINDPATGTSTDNPRQQLNKITGWIDASTVYGSDPKRATALRTNNETGKLKTSPGEFLPYNNQRLPNSRFRGSDFFLAGDERANENIGLTSLHTLFVREHNRLAEQIVANDPSLSGEGEEIYQMSRRIVGAQIQAITYNEFLPVLLGRDALKPYSGYDDSVPWPGVANAFSSAAYRVGHTLLSPHIRLVDAQGNETEAIPLRDAFFRPKKVVNEGIEPVLRGFGSHPHQRVDVFIIDDVRNFLFVDTESTGTFGRLGFDLASLNIHRGRDHGLPSYNDMRDALGLGRKESFSDITEDPEVQRRLRKAYGTNEDGTDKTDDMDIWVAGLAEDRHGDSILGELLYTIVARQFEVLRDGDRFWYQRTLSQDEMKKIGTLADVIRRNTNMGSDEISDNVFIVE